MPSRKYDVGSTTYSIFAAQLDNIIPSVSRSNDLSSHAKLYCFAMQYMIDNLQDACLHILYRDMVAFKVDSNSIAYVVELIRHTYENTSAATEADEGQGRSEDRSGAKLRDLVLQFALAGKEKLRNSADFRLLLFGGGDFVVDFVSGGSRSSLWW